MRGARPIRSRKRPRGAILVAVMVGLAIAATLVASMVKCLAIERQLLRQQARQHQAWWLCQAGAQRAEQAILRDSAYDGEVWQIPAEELEATNAASVEIIIFREAAAATSVRIVARFPAEGTDTVQITKLFRVAPPKTSPDSESL